MQSRRKQHAAEWEEGKVFLSVASVHIHLQGDNVESAFTVSLTLFILHLLISIFGCLLAHQSLPLIASTHRCSVSLTL